MTVTFPEFPASKDYPKTTTYSAGGPHHDVVAAARKTWGDHLATDDWEDLGTKDGVALARKPNPADPNGVPIVKGVTTVPGATTDAVFGAIVPTGMRKLWDTRLDSAGVLQRFDPHAIQFYTVMKGQLFISPRDFVGVQLVERGAAPNGTITVTQTSVPDEEHVPDQSGRVRAKAHFGGWLIEPDGADVKLTYIACISLEGSIPLAAVRTVATEIPMCTGRVRDVFAKSGYAPVWGVSAPGVDLPVVLETESADAPGGKYTAVVRTQAAGTSTLVYDGKAMFAGGAKLATEFKEGGESALAATDDGNGTVTLEVKEAGALVQITLTRQ
ncbi:Bet v1-like protein [Auricularia subglabra TFB-10046 SS5]|nr:Bet v1-like protein [Auricularia subglabra TFB-10046 SS5]